MILLLASLALAPVDTVTFTGDAGFVSTSGNTELTTVNLGSKLGLTSGGWGIEQKTGLIYGTTAGETTTSLFQASLRGDRAVSSSISLYLLSHFDRNTFAGIRSRFAQSAGVSVALVDGPSDKLDAEMGLGYVWQKAVSPSPDVNFSSGRLGLAYQRTLGAKATIGQAIEFLPNFDDSEDLRINSETSLTAPIAGGISMKASYIIRYDGLPQPGFEKTDRILTTGIQVTF